MNIRTLSLYVALFGGFATTVSAADAPVVANESQPSPTLDLETKVASEGISGKKVRFAKLGAQFRKLFNKPKKAIPTILTINSQSTDITEQPALGTQAVQEGDDPAPTLDNQQPEQVTDNPTPEETSVAPKGGLPDLFYKDSTKITAWLATAALTALWASAQHGHSRSCADTYVPRKDRAGLRRALKQATESPAKQQVILHKIQTVQQRLNSVNRARTIANVKRWIFGLGALGTLTVAVLPWFIKKPTLEEK